MNSHPMTSNIKITRDLHVGGGCKFRARWALKNKKKSNTVASRNAQSSVTKRLKKLAKRANAKRIDLLSLYVFPPATPCNTTQFWMDRVAACEQEQQGHLDKEQDLNADYSYGSMADLMDGLTTKSCRLNAVSESLENNTNKFNFLEIA